MANIEIVSARLEELNRKNSRSVWARGVGEYSRELLDTLRENLEYYHISEVPTDGVLLEWLLNGADDWRAFSYGGSSLIYNEDIANRLCSPSELKKTANGTRKPNAREEWLDVQARALYQASIRILTASTDYTPIKDYE